MLVQTRNFPFEEMRVVTDDNACYLDDSLAHTMRGAKNASAPDSAR